MSIDQGEAWLQDIELAQESLREPGMDRTIARAHEISGFMGIVQNTEEDNRRSIHELDMMWNPWFHEVLYIKGKVTFKDKNDEPREAILWDKPVSSNGFISRTIEEIEIDEETRKETAEVLYEFFVPAELLPGEHDVGYVAVVARLDDVIVDTKKASAERAYPWLRTMYPEFIEEVDNRIATVASEEVAVISLADLDLNKLIPIRDKLAKNCIERYLNQAIVFDKLAPYGLMLNGEYARSAHELRSINPIVFNEFMAKARKIKVVPIPGEGDEVEWQLALDLKAIPADKNMKPRKMKVPLHSIIDIVSSRDAFYES